jgi:hypothetical protein
MLDRHNAEPVVKAAFRLLNGQAATIARLYERIRVRLVEEPDRFSFRYFFVAAQLTCR